MTTTDRIRAALDPPGDALQALYLALAAAKAAGEQAVQDNAHRPPGEQFALALQAGDEVLEEMALELAGDGLPSEG